MQSSPPPLLAITLLNYPQTILLPSAPFTLKLNLASLSSQPEKFKLGISGTGLDFQSPTDLTRYYDFAPHGQKEFSVDITPQVDGQVRIDFGGYRQKLVEYITQEPRIRPASARKMPPQVAIIPWKYIIQPAPDEIIDIKQDFPKVAAPKFNEATYQANYADAMIIPDPAQKDLALSTLIKTYCSAAPNIITPVLSEISNSAVVQQTLLDVIPVLVATDYRFASQLVKGIQQSTLRDNLFSMLAIQVAPRNADDALANALQISSVEDRDNTLFQMANLILGKDYKKASSIVDQIQDPTLRVQSIGTLAQKLLGRDLDKAYDIAITLPDPAQKDGLLGIIAQQYALKKSKKAGQVVQQISNLTIRNQVLVQIIQYLASKDLSHASELAETHPDPEQRNTILANICRMAMQNSPSLAREPLEKITDFSLKIQVTFELASALAVVKPGEVEPLLKDTIDLIQKQALPDTLGMIAQAIARLAEDVDPAKAEALLKTLSSEQQEPIKKAIFKSLYVMVDVKKTHYEDELISQVYFIFSSLCSNLNDLILQFINDGGNASNNVLGNNLNSNLAIFNLFRQPFPLFPILERAYAELTYLQKKNFYYFLYPIKENLNEREDRVLNSALQRFWIRQANAWKGQVFVFNMDFIPQQVKPTVIMGSDEELNLAIQGGLKATFGSSVELIFDEGLFRGGKTYEYLTSHLPSPKFKVINIVLTYDFLTNLELLKSFIITFAK